MPFKDILARLESLTQGRTVRADARQQHEETPKIRKRVWDDLQIGALLEKAYAELDR
jgi:hypothetical protein